MAATEFQCTVKSIENITPTVFVLKFEAHEPLTFEAGQFISVIVPGAGPKGRDLRRAYSIASSPETSPIELCVKLVEGGPGTNYLFGLKPGDVFKGYAPYGDFVFETPVHKHACFIATGTGIAPFRSMIHSKKFQSESPVSLTCLLGVRTEDELLYQDELESLSNLTWVPMVSQPTSKWDEMRKSFKQSFKGRVTDYLRSLDHSFPWKETDFYLCGNGAMITEVKTILAEKGVEKESIHQEKYY